MKTILNYFIEISISNYRQYLFSRSLMTATPVDTSFSSHSDDFENLNDSEMSESLIYCLNGNEPIECVGLPQVDATPSYPTTSCATSHLYSTNNTAGSSKKNNFTVKRPLSDNDSNALNEQIYGEFNGIKAKKNHLELDETAL